MKRKKANDTSDIKHMEGLLPLHYSDEAVEIPGARAVLEAVISQDVPWAIVTVSVPFISNHYISPERFFPLLYIIHP